MNSSRTLSITSKLAQFGSRMIVEVNNKMFEQWAKNYTNLLDNQGVDGADANPNVANEGEALMEVLWPGRMSKDSLRDKRVIL